MNCLAAAIEKRRHYIDQGDKQKHLLHHVSPKAATKTEPNAIIISDRQLQPRFSKWCLRI